MSVVGKEKLYNANNSARHNTTRIDIEGVETRLALNFQVVLCVYGLFYFTFFSFSRVFRQRRWTDTYTLFWVSFRRKDERVCYEES